MRDFSGERKNKTKPSYADPLSIASGEVPATGLARRSRYVFTPPRCWLRPPEKHIGAKMEWIAIGACLFIGIGVPVLILWKMSKIK